MNEKVLLVDDEVGLAQGHQPVQREVHPLGHAQHGGETLRTQGEVVRGRLPQ